ncbi:hypothetical protein PFISCL1PPCAC_18937, partial [Pristionchus fissidentatus]
VRVNRRLSKIERRMNKKSLLDYANFAIIPIATGHLLEKFDRLSTNCIIQKISVTFLGQLIQKKSSILDLFRKISDSNVDCIHIKSPNILNEWISDIFSRSFIVDLLKLKEMVTINVLCRSLNVEDLVCLYEAFADSSPLRLLNLKIGCSVGSEFVDAFMDPKWQIRLWSHINSDVVNTIIREHSIPNGSCNHVIFHKKTESSNMNIENWVNEVINGSEYCDDIDSS